MAGKDNLIPNNLRSKEEVRRNSAKGGVKSGEVRRKKKMLKECMLLLLDLPVKDTKKYRNLAKLGIDDDDMDNRMLLAASLFARAVSDGDVAAFKEIRNLIGESNSGSMELLEKLDNVLGHIDGAI